MVPKVLCGDVNLVFQKLGDAHTQVHVLFPLLLCVLKFKGGFSISSVFLTDYAQGSAEKLKQIKTKSCSPDFFDTRIRINIPKSLLAFKKGY